MTVRLVDTAADFDALLAETAGAPMVALDTEAASFHRYRDRIYLIQLSTPTLTAVIDPLTVGSLAPIGALLDNPAVTKVFHDADYDLRLFDKEFGFRARNLFDTRIAAQFLNEPGIGLGALLEKYFSVIADKRFQRADWSVRPLSAAMLEYAAGDTVHLCELQAILLARLDEMGRLGWVREEFERLEDTRWTAPAADPSTDFMRMKGARDLGRRALAILGELHRWRSETASTLDRAEFRILGNDVLITLAKQPVTTVQELATVKGVGRDLLERRGTEIVSAVVRGLEVAESDLPRIPRAPRRPGDPLYELRLDALKRRRNALADEFALAAGVLCPNGTLEAIALAEPENLDDLERIDAVRRWQLDVIGSQLLDAVQAVAASAVKEV